MLQHIAKRLLLVVPNVCLLTFLLFACVTKFLGSPAAMMLGQDASIQAIRDLNHRFGFDRPVVVQYFDWLGHALHGNFGRSYATQQAVAVMILPAIPVTLELALWAILLAVLTSVVLNSIPRPRGIIDAVSTFCSMIGITVPNFMLGTSLIYLLCVRLRWLPSSGWVPWSDGIGQHLSHLVLPVLTLFAFYFGAYSLVYRAEYRSIYRQTYIKVAQAKGLSPMRVSFGHALPNAVLPVVTYVGISLGQLVGGAVVTETVFSIPGIGRLFVDAIGSYDFPVMLAIGMLILGGVMLTNLAADIVYTLINPQIRLS